MDSRRIELEASHWLARREAGAWSQADASALEQWLARSTAHRVAFLRLAAAWEQGGRLQALGAGIPTGTIPPRGSWSWSGPAASADPPAPAAAATGQSGHDWSQLRFASRPQSHRSHRAAWTGWLAALVLATGVALAWRHQASPAAVPALAYATAIGRIQQIALNDGSRATLGSGSGLTVALRPDERHLELHGGEAFFEVAKDPARPFVVAAANHDVVAVGTRFSVRRNGTALRIVVTEGTVRLQPDPDRSQQPGPTTLLPAGSVATVSDNGNVLVRSLPLAEASRLLDWRQGYLSFRDSTLQAAVEEFNRYNQRPLVIGDAVAGAVRIGGSFHWSNEEAFVRVLERGFPIRAERLPDRVVLHSR